MNYKTLYRKSYRILENETPLKLDCGLLCDSKCCHGGNDNGMHLYPGEESIHESQSEFLKLREESFGNKTITFATCKGECNRTYRPLACRIYPYAPYIASDGKLYIVNDPRAYFQCPLFHSDDLKISANFKRKIREVFHLLIKDPDIKEYITDLSSVLDEYSAFTGCKLP